MRNRRWLVLVASVGIMVVSLVTARNALGASDPATVQIDQTVTTFGPSAQTVTLVSTPGELAVAYVSADGNSPDLTVTVTGGGAAWTLVARSNAQLGDAEIWSATTTGTSLSVTATPTQPGLNTELTVVTYQGAAGFGAAAIAADPAGAPTITLTPDTTGGLVSAVGFDWSASVDRTIPPDQALLAENTDPLGDTYWAQYAPAPTARGSAVTLNDLSPTTDNFDLAAVEIRSAMASPPTTTATTSPGASTTAPSTTTTVPATTTTSTTTPTTTGPSPTGVVLQPIDGGANFYTSHGYAKAAPLDNPAFFPVGIWYPTLEGTSDVTAYQDLDINMLDRPTASCDLSLLAGTGIYAIPQYGECGGSDGSGIGDETVGLFTDDEVDGNYGPGAGYTYLQSIIDAVPAGLKAGRFFWTNYSFNLFLWETQAQAGPFINDYQQTVSVDQYWFTDNLIDDPTSSDSCGRFYGVPCTTDQAQRGSNYGATIDAIRQLENPVGSEPIWAFVEDGCPFTAPDDQCITPAQMNWAVWSSIIHGARGVVYFNHSFSGPSESDNNFEDPYFTTTGITPQAAATNSMIKSLAPVLNDDTALNYVTAGPAPTTFGGIETMAKYHDGQFTIFADTRESGSTTDIPATFHVADPAATSVTVVNENRTLPVVNGTFTDTFATGSTVHIYQVNG